MSIRAPLAAGAVLSLAVTSAWSFMASLTIGPSGPLDLTGRDLPGSYARLAAGPTGNGAELFAVVAFIFAACLLVSGRRRYRHAQTAPPNGDSE
jgi:hypothetical protein